MLSERFLARQRDGISWLAVLLATGVIVIFALLAIFPPFPEDAAGRGEDGPATVTEEATGAGG